jgi:hypothetical protein
MTEAEFLQSYDPREFPHPSVTVDLVLMTVRDGKLAILLQQRGDHPFKDHWALPGGFVRIDEGSTKRLSESCWPRLACQQVAGLSSYIPSATRPATRGRGS